MVSSPRKWVLAVAALQFGAFGLSCIGSGYCEMDPKQAFISYAGKTGFGERLLQEPSGTRPAVFSLRWRHLLNKQNPAHLKPDIRTEVEKLMKL